MARKRIGLTAAQEAKLEAMARSGATLESITKALRRAGADISPATVSRRVREIKGKPNAGEAPRARPIPSPLETPPPAVAKRARAKPAEVPPPPLPASPDDIPENADPSVLDAWLEETRELATQARNEGELDGFAKMGRLAAALLEHKRKAAPPPKQDPNEDPDMVALAARVAKRLHDYVDKFDALTRAGLA